MCVNRGIPFHRLGYGSNRMMIMITTRHSLKTARTFKQIMSKYVWLIGNFILSCKCETTELDRDLDKSSYLTRIKVHIYVRVSCDTFAKQCWMLNSVEVHVFLRNSSINSFSVSRIIVLSRWDGLELRYRHETAHDSQTRSMIAS